MMQGGVNHGTSRSPITHKISPPGAIFSHRKNKKNFYIAEFYTSVKMTNYTNLIP